MGSAGSSPDSKTEIDVETQISRRRRAQAEAILDQRSGSSTDVAMNELLIHQIELELQNEELRAAKQELEQSQARWEVLYDLEPVARLIVDSGCRIEQANPAAVALLDVDPPTGMRLTAFMNRAHADQLWIHLKAALSTKEKHECTLALADEHGTETPVQVISKAIGNGAGCLVSMVDLTEIRRADDRLRRSQARTAAILDAVPNGIVTLARDGTIETADDVTCRMFDLGADEIVGLEPARLIVGMEKLDATRGHQEVMARRASGEEFPIEIHIGAAQVDDESIRVLFLRDRTPERNLARALEEAVARFDLIAQSIDDIFYLVDADGRALYFSPAYERILGRRFVERSTLESCIGQWIHREDRPRARSVLRPLNRASSWDEEYRVEHADGTFRVLHDRAVPVPGHALIVGVARDISGETDREMLLVHSQRLLGVGTLAAGIAHDITNLLMGLEMIATLALRSLEPGHPAHDKVGQIKNAAAHGMSLPRQIVAFSKRRAWEPTTIDLDGAVEEVLPMLESLVDGGSSIDVRTHAHVAIRAGVGDIEQILLNLVKNATEAIGSNGHIDVECGVVDTPKKCEEQHTKLGARHALLRVSDDGRGMDDATRERLFEAFFTTKSDRGTGLGLANTNRTVERLGGTIEVESTAGRGTTFLVRLPIYDVEERKCGVESVSIR